MVDTPVEHRVMSLDEFIRLFDAEPFELIRGEVVKLMPSVRAHSTTLHNLYDELAVYVKSHALGVVRMETTFILPHQDNPNWVKGARVPDLLYYEASRLAAYEAAHPDSHTRPYALVPDLVAEIVSPNDTYTEIDDKVTLYLQDGVRLIWILDPQRQKVILHQGSQQIRLSVEETLSAPEVIPGFAIPVAVLFPR